MNSSADTHTQTCRQLPKAEVLHRPGSDERLLRIVENVSQRVHPHMEVGDVHTHGLLPHGRLIGVPGTLIVVREGNDGGTHAYSNRGGGWVQVQ